MKVTIVLPEELKLDVRTFAIHLKDITSDVQVEFERRADGVMNCNITLTDAVADNGEQPATDGNVIYPSWPVPVTHRDKE